MELTKRQAQVLAFLKSFAGANGYPPTRVEIAQRFGFRSPNAAQEHLAAIERKGHIHLMTGISRGIKFLNPEAT